MKVIDKITKFPKKDNIYKNEGQQFEAISNFEILNVNELRDLSRGELKPTLISKQKVTFGETPNKVVRQTRQQLKMCGTVNSRFKKVSFLFLNRGFLI